VEPTDDDCIPVFIDKEFSCAAGSFVDVVIGEVCAVVFELDRCVLLQLE